MNEELITRALYLLEDRVDYWNAQAATWSGDPVVDADAEAKADAYETAANILRCALESDEEALGKFNVFMK